MLKISEGKAEQAWSDLQTCHRLCRLMSQGPSSFDYVAARGTEEIAFYGDCQLAHFCRLTREQANNYQMAIKNLPQYTPHITKLQSVTDRLEYLLAVCALARGDVKTNDVFRIFKKSHRKTFEKWVHSELIDWDQVLRLGNDHFDRIAEAVRKPTWSERSSYLEALNKKLKRKAKEYLDTKQVASIDSLPEDQRRTILTRSVSVVSLKCYAWENTTGLSSGLLLERRTSIFSQLTEIALALSAYRTENGEYPNKLGLLSPRYLPQLPNDSYGKGSFQYRRQDNGYIVYSIGPNSIDEAGPLSKSHFHTDDIGIQTCDSPGAP